MPPRSSPGQRPTHGLRISSMITAAMVTAPLCSASTVLRFTVLRSTVLGSTASVRGEARLLCSAHMGDAQPWTCQQPASRSATYDEIWSSPTRSCFIVSRSRTVAALSSRLSKSTVTQYGVPISSWRR